MTRHPRAPQSHSLDHERSGGPTDVRPARYVIFWDIDGTLLTTARAGVPALEDGAEQVLGRRPDLSTMVTAGLTDRMIARLIIAGMGHDPDPATVHALLAAYAASLPDRLRQRRGTVLPGAREALEALTRRVDVANVLLTGNVRRGAEAKLRSYGLWEYFSTGAFAEDGHDRDEIAAAAVRRAGQVHGPAAAHGVLIGDTPYDVRAGLSVGLRVVAVAGPTHPRAELESLGPWWVVDRIPPAETLLRRLDELAMES